MQIRRTSIISIIFLLAITTSCGERNNEPTGDTLTINVTANFPTRELILQDFMNVEYIALDDTDEFITQGLVEAIGNEFILVRNQINDGNILVFDRKGSGLRVINRRGQGGEEYLRIGGITVDEDNGEIFVQDFQRRRFLVYDLYGNFRRSFPVQEGIRPTQVFNFDDESLLVYSIVSHSERDSNLLTFVLISKQDGTIIQHIDIPYEQRKQLAIVSVDSQDISIAVIDNSPVLRYQSQWMLMEPSADTLFTFSSDRILTPLIARTPSVQSRNPETFLFPVLFTERYYFMQTVRKVMNFTTWEGFPTTNIVYDRQQSALFEYTIYNNDFYPKRTVNLGGLERNETAFWQIFQAYQLIDAYENGELRGRLKEVASRLDEESNPVIMIVTHKN